MSQKKDKNELAKTDAGSSEGSATTKKKFSDPLVKDRIFPDAGGVFSYIPSPLTDALQNAIVVLDTNTLLVPYGTGSASMGEIANTYARLAKENWLRVPGQVVRERTPLAKSPDKQIPPSS